jgi:hypothetical protein
LIKAFAIIICKNKIQVSKFFHLYFYLVISVKIPVFFVILRSFCCIVSDILGRLYNLRKEKIACLTDSLSSIKHLLSRKISHQTHPLVYECKQMCSDFLWNKVEVEIMWIPSHVWLEKTSWSTNSGII